MLLHELKTEECVDLLKRTTLGHLGCALAGQPYVVPIQFSYDVERNCLYAFSSLGQKIAWMRENPYVCVEVSDIADKNRWISVLVFGRYEEVQDSPEHAEIRKRVWEHFQERREWWLPAAAKLGSRESPPVLIFQIVVDRLTGRSASRDGL
jgi:nitroimidazol reductase NimA-like FMN-containing flavoprotein (pyridoxamine 5'-phosphate oxidase superfamily)